MGKLTNFFRRSGSSLDDPSGLSGSVWTQSVYGAPAIDPENLRQIEINGVDRRVLTYHQPDSIVAENFKILRSHILHPRTGLPSKFVMVTSAIPGEGKTFVAINLAFSFARSVSTVLVESDLRNPSLSNWLEGSFEEGLAEALLEKVPVQDVIYRSNFPNLYLIPAGQALEEATDAFSSEKLVVFLDQLRQYFPKSFIIFDSSPILVASEPLYLSRLVDGILMVVRYAYSERDGVNEAVEKVGRSKILGLVFNGFNISSLNIISSRFKYYRMSAKYYRKNES